MKAKSKIVAISSFAAFVLSPLAIADGASDEVGNIEITPIDMPSPALPEEECVIAICPGPIEEPVLVEEPILIKDGETTDEPVTTDVEVSDGETVDGEITDGDPVDGEITDGETVDGEVTENEPVDEVTTENPVVDEPIVINDGAGGESPEMPQIIGEVPIDWVKRGGETPEIVYHTMAISDVAPAARPEAISELKADIVLGQEDKGAAIELKSGQAGLPIQQEKKGPVALVKKGRVFLR